MFSIDATNGSEGQYNAVRAVWALEAGASNRAGALLGVVFESGMTE